MNSHKPTEWDKAYRRGTLRPKQEFDSDFDDRLDRLVVAAVIAVIGGIALWGVLR